MEDTFDPEAGDVRAEVLNIREGGARNVYAGTVTLTMGGAQNISAENVTIKQGGAQSVEAQAVTLKQGGILQVNADKIEAATSGIGLVRAHEVSVGPGCQVIGTLADSVSIDESLAPVVVVRGDARLDQSGAGVLVSNRVTASNSAVMLAVAETVNGDVRVQVKPHVAAVFGAALGAAFAVVLLAGRRGK
jgi:hypothetical protein